MKHFTKEQIEEIRIQLATKAVRDSDFDTVSDISDDVYVPILKDGNNKKTTIGDIKENIYSEISSDGIDGKILSTNDYTDGEKEKLESIESGAQVNVIDGVSVNGTDLEPSEKKVNVTVPTALSDLSEDATHRLVTNSEKATWNGKYSKPSSGIPKTDLSSGVQTSLDKADTALQEHQSLADYVNGGSYNSTTKKIELKHDSNTIAEIDATAFIKDGMVNDVQITGGNLVISFNTDSGKEAITIPLTDIFNPENYYTKTATNELLNQKQPTIADLEEIRSGASKGNTAYQKPSDGIPASDLAVGVIPDVPEEATNAEVDALFE